MCLGSIFFTVGVSESLLVTRISPLLEEYHRRQPLADLVVIPGTCGENLQKLAANTVDAVFLVDRELTAPEWNSLILTEEPVIFVASPNHPGAGKALTPEALSRETLILTGKGCPYRSFLDTLLYERRVAPKAIMEIHSIQTIKQFTGIGLGLAFLPHAAVKPELSSGRLIMLPWEGPQLTVYTQFILHKDKWLTPPVQALADLTKECFSMNTPQGRRL